MSNSLICELIGNHIINEEFFVLQFPWEKPVPKAGQFFMLRHLRSTVYLPRPISVFEYNDEQKTVKFLISRKGRGTEELSGLNAGERVHLTGPLGNTWEEFLPENGKVALVGGSAGIAPLCALIAEKPKNDFHFFAGFRQGFREKDHENAVLGAALHAKKLVISAEDGRNALIGRIVDFIFEPENYDAFFACGPAAMLKALYQKCETKNTHCFISLENRFACGVGACFGCTINTKNGNRRCCKDGPIFKASEVLFDG